MRWFLQTERIGFAHWHAEDLPLAQALWGDAEVTRYIAAGGVFSGEQIEKRLEAELENQRVHGVQYWPIFELESGAFMGCCGLRPFPEDGVYELGFHLLPAFWGRGLGPEAARAVIGYAFGTLGVKALVAGHHPGNAASARVLGKLGFAYTHESLYPPTGLMHAAYRLERPQHI